MHETYDDDIILKAFECLRIIKAIQNRLLKSAPWKIIREKTTTKTEPEFTSHITECVTNFKSSLHFLDTRLFEQPCKWQPAIQLVAHRINWCSQINLSVIYFTFSLIFSLFIAFALLFSFCHVHVRSFAFENEVKADSLWFLFHLPNRLLTLFEILLHKDDGIQRLFHCLMKIFLVT